MKRIILIGIQARSTSERLPNKIHMLIDGKPALQHVIDSCLTCIRYMQNDCIKHEAEIKMALLVPKADAAVGSYQNKITTIEGDEHDVLSRYVTAAKQNEASYIVRITADCVRLPTHIIAKHIKTALIKERDYTTNTHYRTFREGWDIEVLSKRLLEWLDKNAKEKSDREHVTSLIHAGKTFPFTHLDGKPSICHVMLDYDDSFLKTSIDTKEEIDKARAESDGVRKKRDLAKKNGVFVL